VGENAHRHRAHARARHFYDVVKAKFTEKTLTDVSSVIAMINARNRLAIGARSGLGGSCCFRSARFRASTVQMRKTVITRKKRGPAPTGKGEQIVVRMQPSPLAALDGWIKRNDPEISRPEAIRRLVDYALDGSIPPKHIARMAPLRNEPPGMERDSKGHAIPMKERLPEDRTKAKRAKRSKKR